MSAIDELAQSLNGVQTKLFSQVPIFASEPLRKIQRTVESIIHRFGDLQPKLQQDKICAAFLKLRRYGPGRLSRKDCYFLCWGVTERCDGFPPLVEDEELLQRYLDRLSQQPPPAWAWKGLLDAYFRCDPRQPAGRRLRNWLQEDLNFLWDRTQPALRELRGWLKALQDERALLSDHPTAAYAEAALRGDEQRINRLRTIVPEGSWFWQELVLSQIETVARWPDDRFKQVLKLLIEQLRQHQAVADDGLRALLIRYHRCRDRSPHDDLKRFAVDCWGSPQVHRQVKWALVPPEVKTMVSQWLVLEDLEDFFLRLQAHGSTDQRRLRFWRRFLRQISYSRILLGNDLWSCWDPDWREFRTQKRDRISCLHGGGRKNAFIMKIGRYYFVEFSETGDACYGYDENNAPFQLERNYFRYPDDLKDRDRRIFWGPHGIHWEEKFLEEFAALGVYPDH